MEFESLTNEWLEMTEAASEEELVSSPFYSLAWSCGPPGGVAPNKRVIRQIVRIGKANEVPDDDEQMVAMVAWLAEQED